MSQMFFSSITMPGTPINEDTAYADKTAGWVIDAATGLTDSRYTSEGSDGEWFKNQWDKYLGKLMNNSEYTIKEIVKNGIKLIRDEFFKEAGTAEVKNIERPSASLAMVRFNKNTMEYLLLGDCSLLIQYADGHVERIKDTSLEKFDGKAISELDRIRRENNTTFQEARKAINPLLIKHRCMKNTPEGYWSLEFNDKAVEHCIEGKIPAKDVDSILLLTDGFASVYDIYGFCSIKELFSIIKTKGLNEVCNIIRNIEDKDSDMREFPRFKKSDDTSAVYYRL